MRINRFAKDIVAGHPMRKSCSTDLYYAKVCNELLQCVMWVTSEEDIDVGVKEDIAITVALYFEDIVSDSGIWHSFVKKNRELYGFWVPFYDVDYADYMPDEPHVEDIRFLIWQTLIDGSDELINPDYPLAYVLAERLYEILYKEFEKSPINDELKEYFIKASFTDDYINLRSVLLWVFDSCYLTYNVEQKVSLFHTESKRLSRYTPANDSMAASYNVHVQFAFKYKVGPLALLPQEWLAMILEFNHNAEKARLVRSVEYRDFDIYHTESVDDKYFYFIGSDGLKITVEKNDFQGIGEKKIKNSDGCVMACVKFGDMWHPNGMSVWDTRKESFEEQRDIKKNYRSGISKKNFDRLMKMSGGSPLFYFRDGRELRRFMIDDMGCPEHIIKDSKADDCEFIAFWIPAYDGDFYILDEGALCIKDPRNPYYDEAKAREDAIEIVMGYDYGEGDMVSYLISHGMLPDAAFPSALGYEDGRRMAQNNLDFLARISKLDNY